MAEIGRKTLQRELREMAFDGISGKHGSMEYHLENTSVISISLPDVRLLPRTNTGLTTNVLNASISIKGTLRYILKSYIEISDTVDFMIDIQQVSIDSTMWIGATREGKPTLELRNCSSDVGFLGPV